MWNDQYWASVNGTACVGLCGGLYVILFQFNVAVVAPCWTHSHTMVSGVWGVKSIGGLVGHSTLLHTVRDPGGRHHIGARWALQRGGGAAHHAWLLVEWV